MKKLFICAAAILLMSSCGSMSSLYDVRPMNSFAMIDNNTPFDIHYYQGNEYRVRVCGHRGDINSVYTQVVNGQLMVGYDNSYHYSGRPYIEVYSPYINQYNNHSSGNFYNKNTMNMNNQNFHVNNYGHGNTNVSNITVNNINVNNYGSGDIKVNNGTITNNTQVNNQGTGNIKGNNVNTHEFRGQSTNTGNINMRGNATTVTTTQQGTGKTEYKRTSTRGTRNQQSPQSTNGTRGTNATTGRRTGSTNTTTTRQQTQTSTTTSNQQQNTNNQPANQQQNTQNTRGGRR